jgi:phospholipase C
MAFDQIQHVFVLMFENHSFDHLLGFSGISGTDAATGLATTVNGLSETEAHTYNGVTATVSQPADYAMVVTQGTNSRMCSASCAARMLLRTGWEPPFY